MPRGRRPNLIPTRSLNTHLDSQLMARIDERLWSKAEGKVPAGSYKAFFTEAAILMLRHKTLDLAPYIEGAMPLEHVVQGFERTIATLKSHLEGQSNAGNNPRNAGENRELEGEGGRGNPHGGGDD